MKRSSFRNLAAALCLVAAQTRLSWASAGFGPGESLDVDEFLAEARAGGAPSAPQAVLAGNLNGNGYPHKIDDLKVRKIVKKAGFYNGLHNGYYVFGVDEKHGEVVSSRDLLPSEKYEAFANLFAQWPQSLIDAEQITKKVIIEGRNARTQCSALIQYSRNSRQSPQVLANVSLYKCTSEQGKPRPEFHFTYTRLEVSRIMSGAD